MKELLVLALLAAAAAAVAHNCSCAGNSCFSVVPRAATEFRESRDSCEQRGGRLLSRMSAESRDALRPLLGDVRGDVWTGLRLPQPNCTEPLLQPRRFQWMAEELSGAELPAAAPEPGSPCAPLCVSLSADFTLTARPCGDRINGHVCAHRPAGDCEPLRLESGEAALYNGSAQGGAERCLIEPGSIAVRLPSRAKYLCAPTGEWIQAPWNCEVFLGGCQYNCSTYGMKPQCACPPGEALESNELTCAKGPSGPCASAGCEHACLPHVGCVCRTGYELKDDGKGCRDIDECQDNRVCKGMLCSNKPGTFECKCPVGYQLENNKCVDVNECISAPCEHVCSNTVGSYTCSCIGGFAPDPKNKHKCVQHCPTYECPAVCDPNNPEQCHCPPGYIMDVNLTDIVCVDINECEMNACDQNCVNTYGSFSCSCYTGYYLDDDGKCSLVEGTEDSGLTTPTYNYFPTPTAPRDASLMTPGAMVGIIVCILLIIVVLAFLLRRKRWTMNGRGAHKPHDEHLKELQQVTTEEDMKTIANRYVNHNSA